jgi:putative transposase
VNRQFPHGIAGQRLNLMADNGCQPTSLAFMRACAAMGIRQAFTSYSNPKGNADTERFLRTLTGEALAAANELGHAVATSQALYLTRWLHQIGSKPDSVIPAPA